MKGRKSTSGFTLMELMIATSILGLLASVAWPSYETYRDRARFSEVILAASTYRNAIIVAAEAGRFGSTDDIQEGTNGIPDKQKANADRIGIHVHKGTIKAEWRKDGSPLEKVKFELTAQGFVPPIRWTIGGSCVDLGYC